jgi:hypothetical protein
LIFHFLPDPEVFYAIFEALRGVSRIPEDLIGSDKVEAERCLLHGSDAKTCNYGASRTELNGSDLLTIFMINSVSPSRSASSVDLPGATCSEYGSEASWTDTATVCAALCRRPPAGLGACPKRMV